MKILGSAKQAKLTFVYYAHIGIMGLAEAMRIELDGKLARLGKTAMMKEKLLYCVYLDLELWSYTNEYSTSAKVCGLW